MRWNRQQDRRHHGVVLKAWKGVITTGLEPLLSCWACESYTIAWADACQAFAIGQEMPRSCGSTIWLSRTCGAILVAFVWACDITRPRDTRRMLELVMKRGRVWTKIEPEPSRGQED